MKISLLFSFLVTLDRYFPEIRKIGRHFKKSQCSASVDKIQIFYLPENFNILLGKDREEYALPAQPP